MKLIVGLGNPGKDYIETRHNVGFMVIDEIAKHHNAIFNKQKGALYAQILIDDEKVTLLKPQKYINLSGEVILDFINYYKIDMKDVLIVSDDLDLNIGSYKLKSKGSSGGHNGLKNIEQNIGTVEYQRLKIGISNNKNIETKDYVLGKFSKEQKEVIEGVIDKAVSIVNDFVKIDFLNLMNKYNGSS